MSMTTKYSIPENAVVVGLCAGRHDMPVGEFIFPTEVDPTDFRAMSTLVSGRTCQTTALVLTITS